MKILKRILYSILLFLTACLFTSIVYYFIVTKDVRLYADKLALSNKSIVLYDDKDVEIQNLSSPQNKITTPLGTLPSHVKSAFIDTEDKRFYSHKGFDLLRIAKASYNNIRFHSFKEGASTISQQLIKNTHLNQEKTLKRKLKEWKLTQKLEKKYSKNDILEKYLNTIYFGHNCFGIDAASRFYFNKKASDLDVSEAAILAGLIKSPNNYSPFKNPTLCLKRRNCVLTLMLNNKSISRMQYENALNAPLPPPHKQSKHNYGYVHFVFDELDSLSEKYHFKVGGKIEIFTHMDQVLQSKIEELTDNIHECDKNIMLFDNHIHGYKACVSSIENIRRSPASLIKPLLIYAPALEENLISPATPILDEKVNYSGYAPENYDKKFHGYVSARECVEQSLNIPAVKTLSALGLDKARNYLNALNLKIHDEDVSLALALGGMKNGFTLRQLMESYSVFPNAGNYTNGHFVSQIKINGVTVFQQKLQEKQVFSPESAYLMTDMLKSTAKKGTAKKLRSLPFDIAAKTGTAGTENGNTDAYAIAFTPKITVGVWLGNKNNAYISQTGGGLPCNVLYNIYEYLYNNRPNDFKQNFEKPENIVSLPLDKYAYYDTHTILQADNASPIEYRFFELFKKDGVPLKQSQRFTKPSIPTPTVTLQNNYAVIHFPKECPNYYEYQIDRYDYVRHTTVYHGPYIENFIDENLQENKTYIYTIIPVYKENIGEAITLSSITTKDGNFNLNDSNIIKEDWWKF